MIKVAFLNHETKLGGVELMLLRFLQSCDRSQVDPVVIVAQEGEFADVLRDGAIAVSVLPVATDLLRVRRGSSMLGAFRPLELNRAVRSHRQCISDLHVDAVVSNSLKAHVYGSISMRGSGIPYGWRLYDIIDRGSFSWLQQSLLHGLARRSPRSIACGSEAVRKPLSSSGVPDDRLRVIYSGIDTDRWFRDDSRDDARRTMNLLPHEIVVTLPGRILPSKGHDVFVAAAERVAEHLPTAQFLIVGEGFYAEFDYESELKNVVAHRGLAQRMKFLGFQKDMATVYQASDIIVVPSLIPDSLPTVILEAMAAGKIVIASRIGGAAEIITDGHDGFLVAPGDSEALSQKILGIVRARERWGEIGQRARDRIRESFHHTRYVEEMYLWLQELAMSRAT